MSQIAKRRSPWAIRFLMLALLLTMTGITWGVTQTHTSTIAAPSISPYLWGTNLSLYDQNDLFLTNQATVQLTRQLHVQMVRFPDRGNLAATTAAANQIHALHLAPLLILHYGLDRIGTNKALIQMMNTVFGNETVYYEYGNEMDLPQNGGVQVAEYTASWNQVIPQLKPLALNGKFVGPVNFQANPTYVGAFVQKANPRPDAVSWHEYTCGTNDSDQYCLSHIDNWTRHIQTTRQAMGSDLPIMITEYNWNPNPDADPQRGIPADPRAGNTTFLRQWTQRAIQVLISNQVFAANHYVLTNNAKLAMINDGSHSLTGAGEAFQASFEESMTQMQTATATTVPATSTITPNTTPGTATVIPTVTPGTPTITPTTTSTAIAGVKNYYVSPSGNDSSDGSEGHPFATIQKAAQVVTPGSIVHVLPGTYNEAITVKTDGTANARITFVSDTQWAAKIHTTNSDVPWTTRADYIDIIGFDIGSDGARDGMVNMGSYTRTIANRIHDIPGKCDNIGGSGVTDGNYQAHDNDIIANVVFHIGNTYPKLCQYVHAIYHSNARGHILNNIAYDNAGCGINLWHAATGTVIANNLSFGNQEHGISLGTNTGNTNGVEGDHFIVANNISINNALLGIRERTGVGSHNQYLNNMVYENGTAPFGDENYNWPSAAGSRDVNTITHDVQFVQYKSDGTGDYHLQAGSPAIDAGTNVGAPPIDYDGKPRPQGKGYDIGPFEYLGSGTLAP